MALVPARPFGNLSWDYGANTSTKGRTFRGASLYPRVVWHNAVTRDFPFSPRPARAMGAAITSCVNKHGSSRWLTPNSSQHPRGSANRHHPFSLMFLPEFYSPFFLWSRGIDSSLPALPHRFPRFFNDVIQSCILRQGNQFHIHQKSVIGQCYPKNIKSSINLTIQWLRSRRIFQINLSINLITDWSLINRFHSIKRIKTVRNLVFCGRVERVFRWFGGCSSREFIPT